jgi:chorismate mutase
MLMPAVAAAKQAAGLPILDPVREARVEARAAARAVAAGLAPEPAAAFVRAQIAAAREVQVAAAPAGDAPTLDAVRAAIDRIDDTLLAALAAAVPIATAPDVLAAAIRRDAAVPGLRDGRARALAAALRALRPSGAPADAGLRGLTASRKLALGRGVRAEPERRERDGIARWPAGWGRQRGAGG